METHHYGRDRSQFGELFAPPDPEGAPVAVVIHGGFWRARYGRGLMHAVCRDLVERGWVAWNLEYRRVGRQSGGGYPRTLEDVAAGIDHLADLPHARLDLRRVVAVGHSAGGHLAAWAATRATPRVPLTGVAVQAGVVDLRLAWELRLSDGVVAEFLGAEPEAVPERVADASPAERLPLGVPALLTHGGRDAVVPPVMSERFAAAARAAGDEVELVVEPEEEHMGHVEPGNPLWAAVTTWLG